MKSDAHAYEVENREMIAETPTLRVVVLTLSPGVSAIISRFSTS